MAAAKGKPIPILESLSRDHPSSFLPLPTLIYLPLVVWALGREEVCGSFDISRPSLPSNSKHWSMPGKKEEVQGYFTSFFALPTTTITQPLLLEIPRPRVIFHCFRRGKPFFSCLHDFKFLSSYCDFRVCAHYTDFNRASPESILNGKGSDENPSILPNLEEEEDSRSQP